MLTGRVELDARLAPARDLLGMALGVGRGEAAAGVAGAGDQAGADRARLGGEAERLDRRFGGRDLVRRHAGDQQVLPDRETDIAVAHILRDRRQARASARAVSLPTGSTTPIQFSPSCFCACTPM